MAAAYSTEVAPSANNFFLQRADLDRVVIHLALLALSKACEQCDHRHCRVQALDFGLPLVVLVLELRGVAYDCIPHIHGAPVLVHLPGRLSRKSDRNLLLASLGIARPVLLALLALAVVALLAIANLALLARFLFALLALAMIALLALALQAFALLALMALAPLLLPRLALGRAPGSLFPFSCLRKYSGASRPGQSGVGKVLFFVPTDTDQI